MSAPERNPHIAENNARNLPRFTSREGYESELISLQLSTLTDKMGKTISCLREWYVLAYFGGLKMDPKAYYPLDLLVKNTEKILDLWNERGQPPGPPPLS